MDLTQFWPRGLHWWFEKMDYIFQGYYWSHETLVMGFTSLQVTSLGNSLPPIALVCIIIKVLLFKSPLISGVLFTVWGGLLLTGFAGLKRWTALVRIPNCVPQQGQYDGRICLSSFGLGCIAAQNLQERLQGFVFLIFRWQAMMLCGFGVQTEEGAVFGCCDNL